MYNVSYRMVRTEEDAEDVLQEAFVSAFRNLSSYRGDAAFGAWLKRIVVNKSITLLKKRRPEPLVPEAQWEAAEEVPTGEYSEEFTVERVKKAIEELPDGYRSV